MLDTIYIIIMKQTEVDKRRLTLVTWLENWHDSMVFMDSKSIMHQVKCYKSSKTLQRDLLFLESKLVIFRKYRYRNNKTLRTIVVLKLGRNLLGYHNYDFLEKCILSNKDNFFISFTLLIPEEDRINGKAFSRSWGHPDKFIEATKKHGWRTRIIAIKLKRRLL